MILGRKTSVSLEDGFWQALREIANGQQTAMTHLINLIAEGREHRNLSSAVRVYVLRHYQARAVAQPVPATDATKSAALESAHG